jgi:phospholipid/cholesterol/gamma-HCH transport system substrate-binding protein
MLTYMTKAKVVAFVVIALVTTTFLAVHYVGLDRYVGGYQVTVEMPDAGGLFKNSEVTYRGVPVGRVESLSASPDGAIAVVRIEGSAPAMPAEVEARVVDRSAIGEQYLDLRGGSTDGKKLEEGAQLTMTAAGLPPSIDGLLRSSRDMIASVPSNDLNTVIDEGYEFSHGNGRNLGQMLKTSSEFARTADRNFLVTVSLIDNSGKVLATQEDAASSFRSFSKDMSLLADALAEQDSSWRQLIEQTPASVRQMNELFRTVGQPLGQLMSNLISTAEVFGTNASGVKETMIRLPEGISITYAVMTSKGMRSAIEPTFFTPLPCVQGYEGTEMRQGTDTTPGKPFNLEAGCTMAPSTGVNVRGPQAVLRSASSMKDLMGGEQ